MTNKYNEKIEVELTEEEKNELLQGLPLTAKYNLDIEIPEPEQAEIIKNLERVQRILQHSLDINYSVLH